MPEGGCVCGNVRYEVKGDSEANVRPFPVLPLGHD
jgi:hypothetical protein